MFASCALSETSEIRLFVPCTLFFYKNRLYENIEAKNHQRTMYGQGYTDKMFKVEARENNNHSYRGEKRK